MTFQIIEQKLGDKREPLETTPLPDRFESESRAETAIKIKIATADHAGYDAEHKAWWAKNDDGSHIRYFVQSTGANA
ncbi:hypothetical protein [Terrarubrum flagellatum]|uniref:hypothetical protein n=1 Tax=Terrirubrum flagellatum TaxID=2895980 RepID=UPI0031451AD6